MAGASGTADKQKHFKMLTGFHSPFQCVCCWIIEKKKLSIVLKQKGNLLQWVDKSDM
jgi:hypothetical protein